jgi:alkyl hydroperoxide reductase subunit D
MVVLMNAFNNILTKYPELKDQMQLFEQTLMVENQLELSNRRWVCWAAALALQNPTVIALVKERIGEMDQQQTKAITLASSRMAVTNPYFMSRNVHPLQAGGDLASLQMRPFNQLGVSDNTGYHYACIAISAINGGFVCFNSHLSSLKTSGQTDEAIDQAMRLVCAMLAIKQIAFNSQFIGS